MSGTTVSVEVPSDEPQRDGPRPGDPDRDVPDGDLPIVDEPGTPESGVPSEAAPPHPPAGPDLPVTGVEVFALLLLAVVLVVAGVLLRRLGRRRASPPGRRSRPMKHRTPRTHVVTAATAVLALGLSSLAVASETTVSTQTAEPGRQLEVLDLVGNSLEELHLRDGRPQPFEVRVTDTDQDPGNEFWVDTTMGNLHLVDGEQHLEQDIGAQHVSLSFPGNPLAAAGVHVDLEPRYLLSTTGDIACSTVDGLLSLDLLGDDPLCSLVGDLHDVTVLLNLTDDDTMAFDGAAIIGDLVDAIDLDRLELASLPLVPGHGEAGAYDVADCENGIGAAFCAGTTATVRQALRAEANGALITELEALLNDAVEDGVDLVGPDGIFTVEDVLAALTTSDEPLVGADGTPLGDTVASFGQALGDYDPAEQVALINSLLEAALEDLALSDLLHLTGRYSSYPALSVDVPDETPGGEYEGTLVVTLVE